jgi:hypothetical protein
MKAEGRSGFQLNATRNPCIPPPLPPSESRPPAGKFSTARRSQPPPRKRRPESLRELSAWTTPPASRASTGRRQRAEHRPATNECDPEQFGARCIAFEPKMSELAVSNDVLRESMPVQAHPTLSTRLERQLSAWFPTFERRLIDALYWFSDRTPWQRGALSVSVGAAIGLSIVFVGAGVFGWQRNELPAAARPAAALAVPAVSPNIAPLPAATVAPVPAPSVVATPEPSAPEPLVHDADAKPAAKHAKKRSRWHRRGTAKNGTWTFPRPQRRSP